MTSLSPRYRATRVSAAAFKAAEDIAVCARQSADKIIEEAQTVASQLQQENSERELAFNDRLREMTDAELHQFIDDQALAKSAQSISRLLGTAAKIRAEFESLTPWFVGFVSDCLRRIVGEIDSDLLMSRIVAEAVAEMSSDHALKLRAHTADCLHLKQLARDLPDAFSGVTEIVPDSSLDEGQMVLEGAGGMVKLGLEVAIATTIESLESVLLAESKMATLGKQ